MVVLFDKISFFLSAFFWQTVQQALKKKDLGWLQLQFKGGSGDGDDDSDNYDDDDGEN